MLTYEIEERSAIETEASMLLQTFDPGRYSVAGAVLLGDQSYPWSIWDGQQLRRYFALDTETTMISDHRVPELAMVSVSDGINHFIVRPSDSAEFLRQHLPYGHHLIAHNVAFDFWVLDRYLANTGGQDARSWLWSVVDEQRVHDSMLLAGLVKLATIDEDRLPSLSDAVRQYCGTGLDKDTYRTRYAETIGQPWIDLDPGFFQYAVADAIATYHLFCKLTAAAKQLTDQAGVSRQFGFLTEAIQVKAAIVLDAVYRNGMHIDQDRARELEHKIAEQIQQAIADLETHAGTEVFHRYKKTGLAKTTKKSGLPKMNMTVLADRLSAIPSIEIPTTANGKITTSVNEFWKEYRHVHPVIDAYCTYTELTKLRTFFTNLKTSVIHPRYRVFVRTGRTSCAGPNVQQLPRGSHVREVVIPSLGCLFLIIDYSAIELTTLATVCIERYGFSKLAEVIKAGIDPHCYTAAMFAGLSLDDFYKLPKAEFKQLRQRAKVINFGFPGGLGAKSLVGYAKHTYNVTITESEAADFRTKLIEEIYPELKLYLSEDSATVLARSLQVDAFQVRQCWPKDYLYGMLKKIVEGNAIKADGTPYAEQTVERAWQQLQNLNQNPDLISAFASRDTSATSPLRKLMYAPVTTPTGRMRGGVSFTAARNTPFSGLAADGAKLAMWQLLKAGYRIVGFIHDEFIIELSWLDDCTAEAKRIERICCESMQQLVGDIPVKCEYALADRWYKQAEAVFDDQGQLQVWRPEPAPKSVSKQPEPQNGKAPNPVVKVVCGEVQLELPEQQNGKASKPVGKLTHSKPDVQPSYCLDSPRTEVFVGDCRNILPSLSVRPDLIFADPPFNIGEQYGTWNDNLSWPEYVAFTYQWIDACLDVLGPRGSIWIHVPDEIAAEIVVHLKQCGLDMINWCLWHYRFGQCRDTNFIRSKEHGLYFARDRKNRIWNPDPVRVPSDRATKYNDKRTQETKTPGMRVPFDVFGIPSDGEYWGRVQGNNAERRSNHENQLPEVYLARVIKALSDPGSLVLDPFAGSGGTGTVARALGRASIGIEIDPQNAASVFERIKAGPARDVS